MRDGEKRHAQCNKPFFMTLEPTCARCLCVTHRKCACDSRVRVHPSQTWWLLLLGCETLRSHQSKSILNSPHQELLVHQIAFHQLLDGEAQSSEEAARFPVAGFSIDS